MTDDENFERRVEQETRLTHIETLLEVQATEIQDLRDDVQDLLDAWTTANGILSIVKWIAGIAAGVLAFLAFLKGGK